MMVWKNIIDFTIKILQINISLIIKNNFNIYLLCYKYLPIILVKFVIFLAFYKIFIIVNFHLLNFISHTHIYSSNSETVHWYWPILKYSSLNQTETHSNTKLTILIKIANFETFEHELKKKKKKNYVIEHMNITCDCIQLMIKNYDFILTKEIKREKCFGLELMMINIWP